MSNDKTVWVVLSTHGQPHGVFDSVLIASVVVDRLNKNPDNVNFSFYMVETPLNPDIKNF